MVQINFGQREVSCKVVFYGPGVSGKTTNLEIIHKKAPKDAVGEMVSIATESDRTLYFDFLPLDLGQVAGMRTKFQLYTVPGQIYYNATRKLVLQGVDGVIFVADSNPDKMPENLESLQNLKDNLAEMGLTVDDIPVVLQYNKRDLPNALSVADMDASLNPAKMPTFEAVAREGKGVFATLKEVSRLVIEKLNKDNAPAAGRRRTATSLTPQQSSTVSNTPVGVPAMSSSPAVAPTPGALAAIPKAVAPAPAPVPRMAAPAPVPMAPPRPAPAPIPSAAPAPRPAPQPRPAPAPVAEDPKAKHLLKPKPPALDGRGQSSLPTETTDPSLKKYQDARGGGGSLKGLLVALVSLVSITLVLVVLILFVKPVRDAVRPLFPPGIQRVLMDEAPSATVPEPAAAPTPVAAPAAAQAPAGKPADVK